MLRGKSIFAAVTVAALLVTATGGTALSSSEATSRTASAAAATAGCGKTPTLRSGTHSIQSGGRTRSFILRIPDNYNNANPYRLIFGFHWLGGTANDVDSGGSSGFTWSYYGLRQLANNTAIFVAPQGLNNGWANSGGEDLTFVDDMLRLIEADLCVDTTQRFAGGFSYGGGMSYALACARATVFRAVAVYAGAQLSGCSGGTQPIAYIGLHGLRDNVLNISQGRSLRDRFVRNNGCTAQNPPEPAQGSLSHVVTAYSGCRSGYPVVWAAFDGGSYPRSSGRVHRRRRRTDLDQGSGVELLQPVPGGHGRHHAAHRPPPGWRPPAPPPAAPTCPGPLPATTSGWPAMTSCARPGRAAAPSPRSAPRPRPRSATRA
ncbi:hypothetical protein GCM10020001_078590 [Nonomuraea salmonea]